MKNQKEILEVLRKDKVFMQKNFGVESLALFGSYARNEQSEESDIDFLVTLKEPKYTLLMGLLIYLEKKLQHKVDLTRKGPHISDTFLSFISKDLIYV